jgi:hypothetical protein
MAPSCNYAGGSFYFELTAGQTPCEHDEITFWSSECIRGPRDIKIGPTKSQPDLFYISD